MNELAIKQSENIPQLLDRAASALASAKTSGEVLEAKQMAQVAYDAAKSAGRIAKAKKAHDEVIGAVYRAQADAALIEARAKMRLADEYDAAQESGEIRKAGNPNYSKTEQLPGPDDVGLSRKEIHEARQLRDAEIAEPGVIERTVNERVQQGQEPTKAAIREAVERTTRPHVLNNSGNNEWYTPPEILACARAALGGIDLDPASSPKANEIVEAREYYTAEQNGLERDWYGRVWLNPPYSGDLVGKFADKLVSEYTALNIKAAVVLVNNATETNWFQTLASACHAICFPKGRIKYHDHTGRPANTPLQGQAILYFGEDDSSFTRSFQDLGVVFR